MDKYLKKVAEKGQNLACFINFILQERFYLLKGRHFDQILICAAYICLKKNHVGEQEGEGGKKFEDVLEM